MPSWTSRQLCKPYVWVRVSFQAQRACRTSCAGACGRPWALVCIGHPSWFCSRIFFDFLDLFFWLGLFFGRVWWLSQIINWDVQIKLPKLSHLKEMGIHFEFHDLNFILIWCKRSGLKFETSTEIFKAVLTFTVAVLAEHQAFGGWFLLSRH